MKLLKKEKAPTPTPAVVAEKVEKPAAKTCTGIPANRFSPERTAVVLVHNGNFHADDAMFVAMALEAAELKRNKRTCRLTYKRVPEVPNGESQEVVAGDVGRGVYDHHIDENGEKSMGSLEHDTIERTASACGILYGELKDTLFPGYSISKSVFTAIINILEHSDTSDDKDTLSDAICIMSPADEMCPERELEYKFGIAVNFLRAILRGFIKKHRDEQTGSVFFAFPLIQIKRFGIYPGDQETVEIKYTQPTDSRKDKYQYTAFSGVGSEAVLDARDTYTAALYALSKEESAHWQDVISNMDTKKKQEMEALAAKYWPAANRESLERGDGVMIIRNSFPVFRRTRQTSAVYFIKETARGGWTVFSLNTPSGCPRGDMEAIRKHPGVIFAPKDNRFVKFATFEDALKAASEEGSACMRYLEKTGLDGYREIYGGYRPGTEYKDWAQGDALAVKLYLGKVLAGLTRTQREEVMKSLIQFYNGRKDAMMVSAIIKEGKAYRGD